MTAPRWEGHRDLCELQWSEDECTCTCSSIACPGVFACRAVQCQDLWPDREPFLRRVEDVVEDL